MNIERLNLKNFRCYESAEFAFNDQFNLFVGENGAGKTSILDALAVGLGSWLLGITGSKSKDISPDEIRKVLRTFGGDDISRLEDQYPASVYCSGKVLDRPLTWSRSIGSKGAKTDRAEAWAIKELASNTEMRIRSGENILLPVIAYYGTDRLWREPKGTRKKKF